MRSAEAHAAVIERPIASLWPLYAVIFVGFIGYSLMITVFTPMLLRGDSAMLPVSATTAHRTIVLGILLCLYPLGQFIGSPILGAWSDRFGRRPVLLASLTATTACYAVIGAALGLSNLLLLGVASLAAGLAEANVVTAQSAITDLVPPAERNRYFGYVYMSASLAYIVGPLVGGKLADPQVASWSGAATPFWVVFLLLIATTIAVLLRFKETRSAAAGRAASGWTAAFASLSIVVADRRLRRFYGVNFLIYIAIFGFFRSYPMYLVDRFHLRVSAVSEFIAWVGVPIVLANLWMTGFLTARVSVRSLTIWSAALTGLCMAAIVVPGGEAALWPLLFVTAAGLAVCLPSCATLLSNAAEGGDQGRVMGTNQAIQVGAEALSGLAAGLLAAMVIKLPLLVLGGTAVAAALLVALVV
ncbi:MAG TPA: MFS transporter [Acetobacteraceae bacterium]|nr:MFS transporter [Acetobacteraceae bacterium]